MSKAEKSPQCAVKNSWLMRKTEFCSNLSWSKKPFIVNNIVYFRDTKRKITTYQVRLWESIAEQKCMKSAHNLSSMHHYRPKEL